MANGADRGIAPRAPGWGRRAGVSANRGPGLQQNGAMSFAPDASSARQQRPVRRGRGAARSIPPFRICFVCSGNICRSPMAEVVLRKLAADAGYGDQLAISSAGTGDWHVGEQADPRAVSVLRAHGYDGSAHRARQFDPSWFDELDLIVALDRSHERIVRNWATNDVDRSKVQLLRTFETPRPESLDVPDPYYSNETLFAAVLTTIERANRSLLAQLAPALRNTTRLATVQTAQDESAPDEQGMP